MRIKGLDYIRVFGILLVVIYHFFPTALPAGFLGVNILFVLSGFLVSYHLIDEVFEKHTIDFKNYYFKRYLRIFPAVLLMLFVTSLAAGKINPDYTVKYSDQFVASFSFMNNYYEILTGGSYEAQFIDHLFLHTWSLAIEVHFYIFWPIVISAIYKNIKGKRAIKRKFSTNYMLICLGLYAASYLLMAILTASKSVDTAFVYFFDLTRLTSFMMGSFVGIFVKRYSFKKIKYNRNTIISSAIILALALSLSYANPKTYYFGFLLTDIVTAFMILIGFSNPNLPVDKTMAMVSEYSYGIFIFHWPVYIVLKSFMLSRPALLLTVIIGGLLVLFNYHVFEPLFRGEKLKFFNIEINQHLVNGLICLMVFVSFGQAVKVSKASSDMVSLEKDIWRESVIQDIDRIKRDKAQVDNIIRREQMEFDEYIASEMENTSITMLGDSTLLGPRYYLQDNIPNLYINAEGSRPLEYGAEIIEAMNYENNLGDIAVIALGTNAVDDPEMSLENIVRSLPVGKRLIFVTAYDSRYDHPHRVSIAMEKVASKYDFITLMPWEERALENPDYYAGTDGVHFYDNWKAYDAYLAMLDKAIKDSLAGPAKGE